MISDSIPLWSPSFLPPRATSAVPTVANATAHQLRMLNRSPDRYSRHGVMMVVDWTRNPAVVAWTFVSAYVCKRYPVPPKIPSSMLASSKFPVVRVRSHLKPLTFPFSFCRLKCGSLGSKVMSGSSKRPPQLLTSAMVKVRGQEQHVPSTPRSCTSLLAAPWTSDDPFVIVLSRPTLHFVIRANAVNTMVAMHEVMAATTVELGCPEQKSCP